jgi:hypothetical protein
MPKVFYQEMQNIGCIPQAVFKATSGLATDMPGGIDLTAMNLLWNIEQIRKKYQIVQPVMLELFPTPTMVRGVTLAMPFMFKSKFLELLVQLTLVGRMLDVLGFALTYVPILIERPSGV